MPSGCLLTLCFANKAPETLMLRRIDEARTGLVGFASQFRQQDSGSGVWLGKKGIDGPCGSETIMSLWPGKQGPANEQAAYHT